MSPIDGLYRCLIASTCRPERNDLMQALTRSVQKKRSYYEIRYKQND